MEVMKRATTPDGISLNLERWDDGYIVGAYPIAKNGTDFIEANHTFRLSLTPRNGEDMFQVFDALKNGDVSVEDLSSMFWNGEKDKFYLGIENEDDKVNLAKRSAEECLDFKLPKTFYKTYGVSPRKAEEIWFAASNRAAEEPAILAEQGMDYERALVFCNVD